MISIATLDTKIKIKFSITQVSNYTVNGKSYILRMVRFITLLYLKPR